MKDKSLAEFMIVDYVGTNEYKDSGVRWLLLPEVERLKKKITNSGIKFLTQGTIRREGNTYD